MPARQKYTHTLSNLQVEQLHTWFGTPRHAYRVLGLTRMVPFANFQRAWTGMTITHQNHYDILAQAHAWASTRLKELDPKKFNMEAK